MRWSEEHDLILCREILMIQPYQYRSGSKESGNAWTCISTDLNKIVEVKFNTTQKSVRDRYKLLLDKYNKKMRIQLGASGSNEVPTELDGILENIKGEAETFITGFEKATEEMNAQKKADAENAEGIRQKAMEGLKRKKSADSSSSSSSPIDEETPKRSKRNNGSETLIYLRSKAEQEFKLRQDELELKKAELEHQKEQSQIMQQQFDRQNELVMTLLEQMSKK